MSVKPKIYIASMWGRMEEMNEHAAVFRKAGYEVTAQWLDCFGKNAAYEIDAVGMERAALMDLEDIDRADVLIHYTSAKASMNRGGGRHFEMGYAYRSYKWVIVVGEREQVFCYLPGVDVVATTEEALTLIDKAVAKANE
jgi:hypothetical protein